jgi:hypothetical protein
MIDSFTLPPCSRPVRGTASVRKIFEWGSQGRFLDLQGLGILTLKPLDSRGGRMRLRMA